MTKWTTGKLWRKALSKYWEITGYGSAVKLLPLVIGAVIAVILLASSIGTVTVFAGTAAVLFGFLISLPIVMAEVAAEELNALSDREQSFKRHADEVDKRNTELTHHMYEREGQHYAYLSSVSITFGGKHIGKADSFDLPIGTDIGWFEVEEAVGSEIQIGQKVEWRGYQLEIMNIAKRVDKSAYGVEAKIVRLPLLRVTPDDVVG